MIRLALAALTKANSSYADVALRAQFHTGLSQRF
jgi:hypothetical protein